MDDRNQGPPCPSSGMAGGLGRRVGYTAFPPYVSVGEDGRPEGLAVEVVQRAAESSNVTLQWVQVDDAEVELLRGRIDLYPILTMTEVRKRSLHFSSPWWASTQSLISLRSRPLRDAAAAIGKRIAVRTVSDGPIRAERALPGALYQAAPDTRTAITRLCQNQVDGALLEGRLVFDTLLEVPQGCLGQPLMSVPMPLTAMPMATAARMEAAKRAQKLFAAIERLAMENRVSNMGNRWFAIPQQPYSQELLAGNQRRNLALLSAAGGILLTLLVVWFYRRVVSIRRAANHA